jgi:hypothetical protein
MGTETPSGNCAPKNSVPINLSRGDGPKGAHLGKPNGPKTRPIKTATRAMIWTKSLRELAFLVLFFVNLRMQKIPTSIISEKIGNTIVLEISQTMFFP